MLGGVLDGMFLPLIIEGDKILEADPIVLIGTNPAPRWVWLGMLVILGFVWADEDMVNEKVKFDECLFTFVFSLTTRERWSIS